VGDRAQALISTMETDVLFLKKPLVCFVASQQGSTSLIQRKMKIGYNRAGHH
jgi:DNA segregation ATPase FtsK/SpoIIIE-like protein